jgi:hypothetical protein
VKAFRFPLDRALHIRRAQLEVEQAKLQGLTHQREQLAMQTAQVIDEAAATRRAIATQSPLIPGEISTMSDYQRSIKQNLHKLAQRSQELAGAVMKQQQQAIEAERKVKLLEKLRTKRFDEWETQMEKDQENFSADAYLARWTVSS